MPLVLTRREACSYLVGHLGLRRWSGRGAQGVRALLERLRCIQLDPLDPMGTNADLVAMARVRGIGRGDIYRHLYPGHAFEHFAKERCLLPASAFPSYRDRCAETRWWRHAERLERLPPGLVETVLEEVRARGPMTAAELEDRGTVAPMEWQGWRSTSRAASMALDVLWTRCQVVVCGRTARGKLFDVPERALPEVARKSPAVARESPAADFLGGAVVERVEAAGLLARAGGATWSMLAEARENGVADALVEEGVLEEVVVEGSPRRYLAPRGFRERRHPKADGLVRILGPLDPLLWDRGLVRQAFGFEYVWEVYKPLSARRWGWYVCPLLQGDALVGRVDAAIDGDALRVKRLWLEEPKPDPDPVREALERHAAACGAARVVLPRARSRA